MAGALKKALRFLAPDAEKEVDGRDTWPSRTAFVLAAMGGAVGLGNLLRYPAVVFANNGLQWFIPYLIALFFLGIPILVLEISLGQAYRGGVLIAYGNLNPRTKGIGLGLVLTGFTVATYYVPILGFVMHYFRCSFQSTLPWKGRDRDFYMLDVVQNPDPTPGVVDGGSVVSYTDYPATGMVGETLGWTAFMWFAVWLCMFKGVSITGRAVYFTMGLPLIMLIILLGRSLSLPNAGDGVKLYFAEWNGEKLAGGQIWQGACGQVFFSIGVGFGYFTTYASYNSRFANAVQDAVIIGFSNSLYEVLAGFAVFGIIGFLDLEPGTQLSTFTIGFLTYPSALAQMPGPQVWSVLFFLTLAILGLGSAFALMESLVTMVCDTDWGKKLPRTAVSSIIIFIAFLLSIMYCTEFGFYLLDAVDKWTNNLSLLFVVFCEAVAVTTIYRWKDVVSQVGMPAYLVYATGYVLSMVLGPAVGHAVSPEAGAGVGFGIFVITNVVSVLLAHTPDSTPPSFWSKNAMLSKWWWLSFYSCNQLRRDLNMSVAHGNKKWSIPFFWGPILRYISAPILAIVTSFAYPDFYATNRMDPVYIFGFTIAHVVMILVAVGLIIPRAFDIFVPVSRRPEKGAHVAPQVSYITNGLPQDSFVGEGGSVAAGDSEEGAYGDKRSKV